MNYKQVMNDIAKTSDMLHELTKEESTRLKKTLLIIYDDVAEVCKKYRLKPILVGGSALGAVRHQGFIPWDDDLDIGMERSEYKRFLQIFKKELSDRYEIMSYGRSDYLDNRFTQIYLKDTVYETVEDAHGAAGKVYIDIFPIDYAPDHRAARAVRGIRCNFLMAAASVVTFYEQSAESMKQYLCSTPKGKAAYYFRRSLGRLFSFHSHKIWFGKLEKALIHKKSGYCGVLVGRNHYLKECMESDVFFPPAKASFEGRTVWIPHKADMYLKKNYGNYMQIPPRAKRERHFVVRMDIPDRVFRSDKEREDREKG